MTLRLCEAEVPSKSLLSLTGTPRGVGGSPGDLGEQELFGPIFGE